MSMSAAILSAVSAISAAAHLAVTHQGGCRGLGVRPTRTDGSYRLVGRDHIACTRERQNLFVVGDDEHGL